ncbi:hypothetical protein TorRG33x02_258900 [Trema orientale]|uniref:Uncharacterized protein n=1 Tax=Trema orientale TaxID=63057 RepID=A0A2P5D8R3_TREOI|nr:hypothetical protein TorRG33x02_258900 [Trema orientale]
MLPVVLVALITFLAALVAVAVLVVDMMEILVAVKTPAWMIHLETKNRVIHLEMKNGMIHWKEITGTTTMIRMTLPKELEKKNYMGSDTYCLL